MTDYKFGRSAPVDKPAINFDSILTGVTLPTYPANRDYISNLTWRMLGNSTYNNCVAVTWANERRLVTRHAGRQRYPTYSQVIQLYKTQNPNFPSQNNGMAIQTCLEYLHHHGGPDGVKALAFAKIDASNLNKIKQAVAIFGSVWVGLNVLKVNMTQFNNGAVWRFDPASRILGRHSVMAGRYDSDKILGDIGFVTWADVALCTNPYWIHEVEEAWVVVWPEHRRNGLFWRSIDQVRLERAYFSLTGRPLDI